MSGIVRPRGRAPAGIYWRRRLVLVAVVLLATAGAVKLVGGSGDDPGASASSSGPTSGDTAGADSKDEDDAEPKDTSKPDRDDSDVRSGERNVAVRMRQGSACDPESVSVLPSVQPDTRAGGPVSLRLGLSTDGGAPCVLSLNEQTPLLSVSAAGDLVWTSQRCDDLVDVDAVRLEPGWLTYVDAAWSGRSSGQTCGENAEFVEPGDYTVQAALLGGEPSKATISLEEEPEKKPDKDGSDKDGSDKDSDADSDEAKPGDDAGEQGGDDTDSDESGSGDDRDAQDKQNGADDQGSDSDRR